MWKFGVWSWAPTSFGDAGVDISQSKLIGTSSDRENIRGQQENEYEESLAIDQSQEQERLKQEETLRKQLYLGKHECPLNPAWMKSVLLSWFAMLSLV